MHFRMLVTTSLPLDSTSDDARREVYSQLMADESFCGSGGRFGSPIADWFVIGGRWSGLLAETLMGSTYKLALDFRFPELAGEFWYEAVAKQHRTELDGLWSELGGTG